MRRFPNPVLLEWDESIPWCDAERQKSYEALLKLVRRIAGRDVPLGAVIFATGFWLIGRIPGGGGPISCRWQLSFAGPLLLLCLLPYAALQLGFGKPASGTCVHIQFRVRGIYFVEANATLEQIEWSKFKAFEIGRRDGFDELKLRLHGNWLSRRFGRDTVAVEFCVARVDTSSIRQVLQNRGLHEESLNQAPTTV
ncbi:MAG TPA: hypothetical protein VIW67_06125 [Terriglobales bacterium]|jgi:hypothetical protein